jgi:flagellar basal body-associated protein FliL|tara:strand:+ start:131 stop:409 length:279 start_codon:yes stop_codon:yes gene_type:complete
MANLFWNDKKATQEEARKALMEYVAEIWLDRFTVNFHSDDGGQMIQAVLEFDNTDEIMDTELRSKFPAKFMGWRMVVLKVPRGHIEVFFKDK